MGAGDAVCALNAGRNGLHLEIVADCPAHDLVLTIRNADLDDSKFTPIREPRSEQLTPQKIEPIDTRTAFALAADVLRLRVHIDATCREGDRVVMRHGDTYCEVPPPPRAP